MSGQATTWSKLAEWCAAPNGAGSKEAIEFPSEGGKPAETGARSAENAKDVKKEVGGNSVEHGEKNPDKGKADGMQSFTGLRSGTADKSIVDAVKTMNEENQKMSKANLAVDAELAAAHAALLKGAAELPNLLATSGANGTNKTPVNTTTLNKAAADDKALAAQIEIYRKYGSDSADATLSYLRAYWDTTEYLKRAMDEGMLAQLMGGGGGGMPPEAGGMPPGAGAGGGMPPEAGGMPPGAGGELPPELAGAMPPEGAPPGEPGPDDNAAAMGEMGITPEMLEQLIALLKEKSKGEEMPPETKEAVDKVLTKAASVVANTKAHMQAGKFRFKPAAENSPERKRRNAAVAYFQELRNAAN